LYFAATKGFISKQFLTQHRTDTDQQHDLLTWSEPAPVRSNRSASILEDNSWSQELVSLLEPPLKPTASAAALCLGVVSNADERPVSLPLAGLQL
jgi:hypothetical protein